MTIVEFDPSQFEGKDGDKKYLEWLKGLTRVQLMELYDLELLPEKYWDAYFEEENSREWPIDHDFREDQLPKLLLHYNVPNTKAAERSFEAILGRLVPQVAGIQKKLDRLLVLIGDTELKVTVKDALKL